MGLLDTLFPASDGGGLLDFLKRNANLAPADTGLPGDQAGYGGQPAMPAMGSAQPMAPQAIPQNPPAVIPAQPMPQQAPQPIIPTAPAASGSPGFMTGYENLHHGGGLLGSIMAGITGQRNDPQGVAQQQAAQVANVTARALIQKGVPQEVALAAVQPGNTEMLKQLVDLNFGPQTKTSIGEGYVTDKSGNVTRAYVPDKTPISIGEGHIYDPKTGKTIQAYEPEDKTPASVAEYKYYKDNLPPGQKPMDYATFSDAKARALAQNPNQNQILGRGGEIIHTNPDGTVTVVHKNESEQPEATLDDSTVKAMSAQYLAGDRTIMQNLGRGAQGAANIVKLRTEIYKQAAAAGLDGKGIVDNFNEQAGALAGQRTVGTRAANISLAANEANNMIPVALEASEKVPRGSWMPWNQAVQAYQKGTSSPEFASFVAATNSLVNAYVRAVSPGGVPTDSMREHAYSMLNSAQGPEAFKAVVSTMQKEMQAALGAPSQVQKELRRSGDKSEGPKSPVKIDGYTITEH